jgi:hypothetical protein
MCIWLDKHEFYHRHCIRRASKYFGGGYDAFLVKFNSSGIRQWATYYGGNTDEYGNSCAIDGSGNVYLAGQYTIYHRHCIWRASKYNWRNYDAFLVKFTSAGVRQWATYYGGNGNDVGQFLCGRRLW